MKSVYRIVNATPEKRDSLVADGSLIGYYPSKRFAWIKTKIKKTITRGQYKKMVDFFSCFEGLRYFRLGY